MKKIDKQKTVYVAMSGGVDSSVAAALLKKEGYDVVGVFFKPWSPDRANQKSQTTNHKQIQNSKFQILNSCLWQEDRQMAMRVASKLGIKFKTWDFSKEYGKEVVEYMVDEYNRGLTPNPDVMCNKEIKFGLFLKKALKEGADYIATGHYVRLRRKITNHKSQITNKSKIPKTTNYKLLVGIDKNKDQSYFLWTLTQEQLRYSLFPIGGHTKSEVRKLAKKFGLPNYDKKDSQGICFVGKMDVKDFLKTKIKPKAGKIILASTNKIIGTHDGVYYYTLGQRHGLNVGIGGGPYFVISKDIKKNIIYVDKEHLLNRNFTVVDVNWIHEPSLPLSSTNTKVKIRYRNNSTPAKIMPNGSPGTVDVKLSKLVAAITPGQSAVFYRGEEVLGGGIIQKVLSSQ
ncbi:MAG: tRNA 2-thiouridine(34) synthase MnmA [bacterium]|nr:tRNA 2-thiouridine(34) synthase MnmA [bacterium]